MNKEYLLLTGSLKVFKDFSNSNCSLKFEYDNDNLNFQSLIKTYGLKEVAGNGDDISKVLNLLRWCCDHVLHNGGTKDVEFIPKTSLDILDYSYGKGKENGVYCRLQSIVFTECCLALGFKSRILHCLPFNPNDYDTHVVSIVFIDSMNKWIMLDPGNNGYFIDRNDNILSPIEVRQKLANDDFMQCNRDISPNSDQTHSEKECDYKFYMAKNLFYFKSMLINTFGSDLMKNQKTLYCAPAGFDIYEREIAYCQYAIKNSPIQFVDEWKQELENLKGQNTHYLLSLKQFFEIEE